MTKKKKSEVGNTIGEVIGIGLGASVVGEIESAGVPMPHGTQQTFALLGLSPMTKSAKYLTKQLKDFGKI